MSSFAIIQRTSIELRRRIHHALETAPDVAIGIDVEAITLSPPRDQMTGSPRLSLFLYHIEPDGHLRNQRFLPDGATGLRPPPFVLNLRYLVTPLNDDETQNHLILGRIVQHLTDDSTVEELSGTPLDDSFGGSSPALRLSFDPLSMEQLSHVWSALNTRYRLSIAYAVRTVAIDADRGVTAGRRVIETHTVVGAFAGRGSR